MESNYRNKEFEQYVKQNADQYRMFPSEKVWKAVNNALHTRRKWYGAGLAVLLLLTGTAVTLVMISYPVSKKQEMGALKNSPEVTSADKQVLPTTVASDINKTVMPFNGQVITRSKPLFTEPASDRSLLDPDYSDEILTVSIPEHLQTVSSEREQTSIVNEIKSITSKTDNREYHEVIDNQVEREPAAAITPDKRSDHQNEISYPLTIESVTNAYQPKKAGKKLSWQFFVTPTISYRKLNTNKSFDNSSNTAYPFSNLSNINNAVTHKPDMGLQIGLSVHYPTTKNLKIRGGLQFNINRYDIKAYTYNPEVATINLNGANGISSVSTWTYYRNYSGYKSNWLKNYYFSVSAPIGVEMKLLGNNKTSFGIAGTIQPTYIIKDKAYLISTDYKNYAKVPSLVRHVNINTAFEAFVNYSNGNTRWQIGPQVRYQLLSSFQNKYPVKENLFDFGLKVGVFLNE